MPPAPAAASVAASPRVGLVLGAGGAAGVAYHVGTLLALQRDLGWDPRAADVIVGTSAGSMVAGLVRAGLTVDDLAAWGVAAPPPVGGHHVRSVLERIDQEGMRLTLPRLSGPLVSPARFVRSVRNERSQVHTTAMTLLPDGLLDSRRAFQPIEDLVGGWPDEPLWINAVRMSDSSRVVFGRDEHAGVADAIASSCAIPGVFRPFRIGRQRYVDGGAHSPTNADVLVGADVDLAVILSPMTRQSSARTTRRGNLRHTFRRRLQREVSMLESNGIEVLVFEPTDETIRAMGWNALDRDRARAIISSAFIGADAGRYVTEPATSILNRLRSF